MRVTPPTVTANWRKGAPRRRTTAPFTPWLRFHARPIHDIVESAGIAGEMAAFRAGIA